MLFRSVVHVRAAARRQRHLRGAAAAVHAAVAAAFEAGQQRGLATPYEQIVGDMIGAQLMEKLAQDADLEARRAQIAAFNAGSVHIKRALATAPVMFGISFNMPSLNQGGALVHVYTDGSIQANHGGTEMGQGLHTKIRTIVCRELGLTPDRVRLMPTRTDKVPNTSATAASTRARLSARKCATRMKASSRSMLRGRPPPFPSGDDADADAIFRL